MIQRAPFGGTGHESSRVIFGAAALGDVSKAAADRTLTVLLEHGINHIDVAADYGDAEAATTGTAIGDVPPGPEPEAIPPVAADAIPPVEAIAIPPVQAPGIKVPQINADGEQAGRP